MFLYIGTLRSRDMGIMGIFLHKTIDYVKYYRAYNGDKNILTCLLYFTAPYIKQCIRDDPKLNECLAAEINHLRPYLKEG